MAHSLMIGTEIELLGDGQVITGGLAAGSTVRLGGLGDVNFDLGAGSPQTAILSSLLLDGELPIGERTGNADINIPIYIMGPGIPALVAAREIILAHVDQEIWQLTLQLEGLPPTIFDCLRAKVTMPTVIAHMQQDVLTFNIATQRLPFGRSDESVTLSIDAPPGTPGGGSIPFLPDVRLDTYDSAANTTIYSGTIWISNAHKRPGSGTYGCLSTWGASEMGRYLAGPFDCTTYTSLRFWAGVEGTKALGRTFNITLYDAGGHAWALPAVTVTLPGVAKFISVTVPLKKNNPPSNFDKKTLTRYRFKTTSGVYLDDLDMIGSTVVVSSTPNGGVYNIHGIEGSARAPVNLHLRQPNNGNVFTGIIHKPKHVPTDYTPLIPIDPSDPLDGTFIDLPTGTGGDNMDRWQGTYNVLLVVDTLVGTSTTSRTTTIQFWQQHASGVSHEIANLTQTYTPASVGSTKYLFMGRVTLPLRQLSSDCPGAGWHVSINCTGLGTGVHDAFSDIIMLDVEGSTIVFQNIGVGYPHVYVDEPDPVNVNHGFIGTGTSHETAESVMDFVTSLSGEPIGLDPGDNTMLIHCWEGALQLDITYQPRWRGLRLV